MPQGLEVQVLSRAQMKPKIDQSYGVVPVWYDDGELKILVVHQISHRGDRFWNFPKGHKEHGETKEEAALRELQEETGLQGVGLREETIDIKYRFVHEGETINKTVTYFVGEVSSPETKITEPNEIAELRWCSVEEVKQILTHKNSRVLLDKVLKLIKN